MFSREKNHAHRKEKTLFLFSQFQNSKDFKTLNIQATLELKTQDSYEKTNKNIQTTRSTSGKNVNSSETKMKDPQQKNSNNKNTKLSVSVNTNAQLAT